MLLYRNYICQCNVVYTVLRNTYTEHRAVSGVFRTTNYWPPVPHPLSTQRVCPTPAPKAGRYTLAGRWGGGGSIFRKTPDIGLASYSIIPLHCTPSLKKSHKYLNLFVHFLSPFSLPNSITGSTTNWNSILKGQQHEMVFLDYSVPFV
jgi:hypothetical protein